MSGSASERGVGASLALLVLLSAPAATLAAKEREPEINPDGYTSARVCGSCHVDIYDNWKNSLHAFALSDPIFDTAFMQAIKAGGQDAKRVCLRCHAPTTLESDDIDLAEGVTREGVTCDFCHSVTSVHLDQPSSPYRTDVGLVKRSVLRQAASPAHQVAYSELHGRSEFCGGCHNYVTAGGAAVLSTYDEWLKGPYAQEGKQCQDCHMGLTAGRVVREDVKDSGESIHRHNLIHDSAQIKGALAVRIASAARSGDRLVVQVEVENVGSGHMVPTGIPSREIVLEVLAEADGREVRQERRYKKVVADAKARVLSRDFEALLYGARILNDNRIAPREKRLERFTFNLRAGGAVNVTASLTYVYPTMLVSEKLLEIELGEAKQVIYGGGS